jgi:hypothetical protein
MPTFPFEVGIDEILKNPEQYVDAVFSCLESEFLVMPKGPGFVDYPTFERGYEALKGATRGFFQLEPMGVLSAAISEPISIVVLRTMLGFTPPEWGYVTEQRTGVSVTQGFVRSLDRKVRMTPERPLKTVWCYRGEIEGLGGNSLPSAIRGCSNDRRRSTASPGQGGYEGRLGKHQESRRHGRSLCHALV